MVMNKLLELMGKEDNYILNQKLIKEKDLKVLSFLEEIER